jgi:polyferredoxin
MAKNKASLPVWLRRLTQTIFLLLFLYLFLRTAYRPDNVSGSFTGFFFDIDPLVMLTVWLSGHVVASALLLSLITLGVTLVFGRWFCGWICPFGTLHNCFTGRSKAKKSTKVAAGSYSNLQKTKYYILVILLLGALSGANLTGWLDPFSFFYRSLATTVFPTVNAGLENIFGWIYRSSPAFASVASEPAYRVLKRYFLLLEQPHFFWSALFGVLFVVVVALNYFRGRFWCRFVCPLGGLLGLVGKNPAVRLQLDAGKCKNCLDCVAVCQGGANPQVAGGWKQSECLFCWNCHSVCSNKAISFQFKALGVKS